MVLGTANVEILFSEIDKNYFGIKTEPERGKKIKIIKILIF
jgi:hypothetical protein